MDCSPANNSGPKRYRIVARGRVQGVGFRPSLYRALTARGCGGSIRNTPEGVVIEVEAPEAVLREVVDNFPEIIPQRAHLDELTVQEQEPRGEEGFHIAPSAASGRSLLPIPPDLATCEACLRELHDPEDRRHRYPFNTCTACGPRFTIARQVPFDRETNAMAEFPPCPDCEREYSEPQYRRFHAQTLSCPACGPSLTFMDTEGRKLDEPLERTRRMLREGAILAVKGVGGFHLACDATRQEVVEQVRRRKQRPVRPFAVMASELATCRRLAHVSGAEANLLTSLQAPIVLLRKRAGSPLAEAVAPGLADVGVMLPYTPLHTMLFEGDNMPPALVMTSCNRSEEPIALTAEHVLDELSDIVDGVLTHDRTIVNRCDDSVLACFDGEPLPMRRSRGYVPEPVILERDGPPLLATGAMLKNTFALTSGRRVFLSQHIGDVSDADNAAHFARAFRDFSRLLRVEPRAVVCDLHPDYPTTDFARRYCRERGLPLMQMQHHHAHIVSCLAENRRDGPVIGVSWDGTGYGGDGAIWGGEFLIADRRRYKRRHHLAYVPMPGGEQAVWHPTRMALAHLARSLGPEQARRRMTPLMGEHQCALTLRVMEQKDFSPPTSSAGRLFDAVAALLGIRTEATYEGQPACELEAACEGAPDRGYPFDYQDDVILLDRTWGGICRDLDEGVPAGRIAVQFHKAMADVILESCRRLRRETGLKTVAISGGVMQNRTLLGLAVPALRRDGFEVLLQTVVPPNDGGICLGQAAWAYARLNGSA